MDRLWDDYGYDYEGIDTEGIDFGPTLDLFVGGQTTELWISGL